MADDRPDWFPGALAAQDAYQGDFPDRAPVRITVRPQMEVAPPKSFEDYLGEATQPREADPLQRPPVFGLTNRYVDPNDPSTQAGAQRLSNYYGLPGRFLTGDPRNVIAPEVPGQWSDRDEARAALQAGNMTLGGMGMGVDATTGAMPRGFAGTANTLGVGGGRPPRIGDVADLSGLSAPGVAVGRPQAAGYRAANESIGPEGPTALDLARQEGYGGGEFTGSGKRGAAYIDDLIARLREDRGVPRVSEVPTLDRGPGQAPAAEPLRLYTANVNTPTIAGLADRIGARIRDNPMAAEPALSPFDQARLAAAAKRSEQGLAEANARLGPNPTPEEFKAFALRPFPKDPQAIRREVDYRDPSGRPTRTAPLPIGTEQAILGRGYDVATGARPPGPQPPLMQAAERKGPMGSVADLTTSRMASPEEINRAAAASRQGITQPELRALYAELGLTGREPSELVKPSLAATHPEAARQAAIDLKLADRALLNTLTKEQRQAYRVTGKLPGSQLLPSQEAAAPGLAAFEPVKKEVGRAEKAFDTAALRGVKPSLFNLSPDVLRATPADVAQFALPRVAPEMTERLSSVPRGGMARLERAAAAAPVENWGWYNLMQQRDLLHKLHGPEKGEQAFQAWVGSTAGTSMVNPIDNNIRSSTWYLQQILQGKPLPEVLHIADPVTGKTVRTMVGGPPPGYGAKSQIQHADRVKEYLTHSYDPVSNPKPISYYMNLSGNWVPRTVDTHDIRNMVGMPLALEKFGAEESSLLPKEYSYLEGVGQRAATRAGSAQAPHQAATWSGGGEYTGLKSYPAPLQEVINRRAHVTAAVRGITPQQALHDAFTGKAPLLGLGGMALGGAAMGGLADQSQYAQ